MAALLITIYYYRAAQIENLRPVDNKDPLDSLKPDSKLFKLDSIYYFFQDH